MSARKRLECDGVVCRRGRGCGSRMALIPGPPSCRPRSGDVSTTSARRCSFCWEGAVGVEKETPPSREAAFGFSLTAFQEALAESTQIGPPDAVCISPLSTKARELKLKELMERNNTQDPETYELFLPFFSNISPPRFFLFLLRLD